jgi:putative membrane protein insertion efficiency factor
MVLLFFLFIKTKKLKVYHRLMNLKYFLLIAIVCSFITKINAQDANDIAFTKSIFETKEINNKINTGTPNRNPIYSAFSGLFIFYKKCISSQDYPSCNFSPSCSEYALKAIKKKGVFIGVIAAFDRLSRCNHPFADGYKIDIVSHKLKDDL